MSRKNLARKIRELLTEKIRNGEYPPGSPLPSNADLQREFGVSLITANRAVCELAAAGLVYRERGRGTYVSEAVKPEKKTYRIGIVDFLDHLDNPIYNAALNIRPQTIASHLKGMGHEVQFLDYKTVSRLENLKNAVKKLDGLMISRSFWDLRTLANFRTLTLPMLLFNGEDISPEPFNQIIADNLPGSREAAVQTMKYDFPGIIIVYENHSDGRNRRDAFLQALNEQGYDPDRISQYELEVAAIQRGAFSYRMGQKLCGKLPGKLLYITSDVAAFCMMEAFQDHRLTPGKDFQLLSYDNLEDCGYSPYREPILTTLDSQSIKMPPRAAELMIQLIEHPAEGSLIVRIPTSLVIRKTAFNIQP
ncbi:MAG: GntR family transcriptional regulator [Lentisphaeria bacterium]|nr:GntR family transcriptional regulator [Lentisphaeria bacterium]